MSKYFFLSLQAPDNQMLSEKWTEIEFALQMLGISEEEAKGIWSILAAICHLGCAGISVGKHANYCSVAAIKIQAVKVKVNFKFLSEFEQCCCVHFHCFFWQWKTLAGLLREERRE